MWKPRAAERSQLYAVPFATGADGAAATGPTFIGIAATSSAVTGTGLNALDKLTDVSLIAMPGTLPHVTASEASEAASRLEELARVGGLAGVEEAFGVLQQRVQQADLAAAELGTGLP